MSKKSIIARQIKREKLVAKYATLREKLKSEGNYDALDKLPKNSSAVRLKNRCQLTGRPKGFIRRFGISRYAFRMMALDGKIPGVTKASW
ncbi:MAG TPA: 30S ribosomal protein S14 [Saprospiraceae bacterium]|nr:30S ribosomal protein S14 [Saprospiraceae bacterium]